MAKKTKAQKKSKKMAASAKKAAAKAKLTAKKKAAPKRKIAPKKKRAKAPVLQARNQEVEIVPVRAKSRVARAGAGGGDFGGASTVEDVDSESVDELLEEGQSFEAGIVKGVRDAGDEPGEVHSHEVLQDDVPEEYEDQD